MPKEIASMAESPKAVVLNAVRQNGLTLQRASPALRGDKEFITEVAKLTRTVSTVNPIQQIVSEFNEAVALDDVHTSLMRLVHEIIKPEIPEAVVAQAYSSVMCDLRSPFLEKLGKISIPENLEIYIKDSIEVSWTKSGAITAMLTDILLFTHTIPSFWIVPSYGGDLSDQEAIESKDKVCRKWGVEAQMKGSIFLPTQASGYLDRNWTILREAAILTGVLDLFPSVLPISIKSSVDGVPSYDCGEECWVLFADNVTSEVQEFATILAGDSGLPVSIRWRPEHPDPAGAWLNSGKQNRAQAETTREETPEESEPRKASEAKSRDVSLASSAVQPTNISSTDKTSGVSESQIQEETSTTLVTSGPPTATVTKPLKYYRSSMVYYLGASGSTRSKMELDIGVTLTMSEDEEILNINSVISRSSDLMEYIFLDIWYNEELIHQEEGCFRSAATTLNQEVNAKGVKTKAVAKNIGIDLLLGLKPTASILRTDAASSKRQISRSYKLEKYRDYQSKHLYRISLADSSQPEWSETTIPFDSTLMWPGATLAEQKQTIGGRFQTQAQIFLQAKRPANRMGCVVLNQLNIANMLNFAEPRRCLLKAEYDSILNANAAGDVEVEHMVAETTASSRSKDPAIRWRREEWKVKAGSAERCAVRPVTEWDYGRLLIDAGDHDLKAYSTMSK